jgi:hypothetical protein
MPELRTDFESLPEEYQHVIRLAQDNYNITVAPGSGVLIAVYRRSVVAR